MRKPLKLAKLLLPVAVVLWFGGAMAQEAAPGLGEMLEEAPEQVEAPSMPLALMAGEVESLTTEALERVVVGDPEIADVVVLSDREVLIKAERPGTTALIIWDAQGKRRWDVAVTGEDLAAPATRSLQRLLDAQGFRDVTITVEGEQVYVAGRVAAPNELDHINKLLETFPNTVNLVHVAIAAQQAVPLVELEVRIVEIVKDAEQKLGIDWADSTSLSETIASPTAASTEEKLIERVTNYFKVGAVGRTAFSAVLNHLLTEGKARLLASPNLVTLSGKPAETFLGGEVPVITASTVSSGSVTQNIEFKDIGTKLVITPTVADDRSKISSVVETELRTIDRTNAITISGITVPGFKIRRTQTEFISQPNETVVISGLLQDEESRSDAKVPKLSRIPFLGRAFSNTNLKWSQTELLVVVTPRLPQPYGTEPKSTTSAQPAAQGSARRQPPTSPTPADSDVSERLLEIERELSVAGPESVPQLPLVDPVTAYARHIQERIAGGLSDPALHVAPGGGALRLQMHVRADGRLDDVRVAQSSGQGALDQLAVATARRQEPYPSFPPTLTQSSLWLEFPVIFNPD